MGKMHFLLPMNWPNRQAKPKPEHRTRCLEALDEWMRCVEEEKKWGHVHASEACSKKMNDFLVCVTSS